MLTNIRYVDGDMVTPATTLQQPTTYTCNRPNEKNEDRFSEERMQFAGTALTVLGIYDGKLLLLGKSKTLCVLKFIRSRRPLLLRIYLTSTACGNCQEFRKAPRKINFHHPREILCGCRRFHHGTIATEFQVFN